VLSARQMCDQHMKLASETVQAAWAVVRMLDPKLMECARSEGIESVPLESGMPKNHVHMHPLSRWMALCRGNYLDLLNRGVAIAAEHRERTGNDHKSMISLKWLIAHVPDFNVAQWSLWFAHERLGKDTERRPYAEWFETYGYYSDEAAGRMYVWESADRNDARLTPFVQIMNSKKQPGCRVPGNPVAACRRLYVMKAGGEVDGKRSADPMKETMRFFHSAPPDWLLAAGVPLQLQRAPPKKSIAKK
jgi:hypothetical protein